MRCAAIAGLLASIAVALGWDSANPERFSRVMLVYVGASDCAPCRIWQQGDGLRFRQSAEYARVHYREVKSPTLRTVLEPEHWPEDLRQFRNRLGSRPGAPLWLLVLDDRVVAQAFGTSQWRETMLPQVRSLVR